MHTDTDTQKEKHTHAHKYAQTVTENTHKQKLNIANDDKGLEQTPCLSRKLLRTVLVGFCGYPPSALLCMSVCVCTYIHTHMAPWASGSPAPGLY